MMAEIEWAVRYDDFGFAVAITRGGRDVLHVATGTERNESGGGVATVLEALVQNEWLREEVCEAGLEYENICLAIGRWPGDDAATQVREMREIVDKLPVDAERRPVPPCAELYQVAHDGTMMTLKLGLNSPEEYSEWYLSREAAEQAKETEQ